LLVLLGMQLQTMDHFCCSLCWVNEIDLDTDIKLTPPCLVDLKWEFFDSYNRIKWRFLLLMTGCGKEGWS
jgi:hypothetical protein